MLPSLSKLRVGGPKPQVASIGVYADNPPDVVRLRKLENRLQPAGTRLFNAIWPALGVWIRMNIYAAEGLSHEPDGDDREKVAEFREAYQGVVEYANANLRGLLGPMNPITFEDLRGAIRGFSIAEGVPLKMALYEMQIYYIRYVWSFVIPEVGGAPIKPSTQRRVWDQIRGLFVDLNRRFVAQRAANITSVDELDPNINLTSQGTPFVRFPEQEEAVDMVYTLLTEWWRIQARFRWNRLAKITPTFQVLVKTFLLLYNEIAYRPESLRVENVRRNFENAANAMDNLAGLDQEEQAKVVDKLKEVDELDELKTHLDGMVENAEMEP